MKYVIRSFSNEIRSNVYNRLKNEIKLNYIMNDEILNFITRQSILNVIGRRCEDLGYYNSEGKILGENTLWDDKSVWINLNEESKLSELFIRDSEKYFIMKEVFKSLNIHDMENEIFEIIKNDKIDNVNDIISIIKKIL
jgi:hypothetical protein